VSADQLAPLGLARREGNRGAAEAPGAARRGFGGAAFQYQFSDDKQKILIETKPSRIYHNTYYTVTVFDRATNTLAPVAKNLPAAKSTFAAPVPGLLNAKLSPDGSKLAYVYDNDIYT